MMHPHEGALEKACLCASRGNIPRPLLFLERVGPVQKDADQALHEEAAQDTSRRRPLLTHDRTLRNISKSITM